jgi:hypothetical protein
MKNGWNGGLVVEDDEREAREDVAGIVRRSGGG